MQDQLKSKMSEIVQEFNVILTEHRMAAAEVSDFDVVDTTEGTDCGKWNCNPKTGVCEWVGEDC